MTKPCYTRRVELVKYMIIETWAILPMLLGIVVTYLGMVYTILYLVVLLYRKENHDCDK